MMLEQKCIVYVTSWNNYITNFLQFNSKITHFNFSFGNIAGSNPSFILEPSDNMFASDTNISKQWAIYKKERPNAKFLLALGGATFASTWNHFESSSNVSALVNCLHEFVNRKFTTDNIELDGLDFDFELDSRRPSINQCNNLLEVIKQLKIKNPTKLFTLTGFSTSADPASCETQGGSNCSAPYSVHCGELISMLSHPDFAYVDFYNIMAYDAGRNYPYNIALNNAYNNITDKNKVVLGLSIGSQWAQGGNFVEEMNELIDRAIIVAEENYGGIMIWAIHPDGMGPSLEQSIENVGILCDAYFSVKKENNKSV